MWHSSEWPDIDEDFLARTDDLLLLLTCGLIICRCIYQSILLRTKLLVYAVLDQQLDLFSRCSDCGVASESRWATKMSPNGSEGRRKRRRVPSPAKEKRFSECRASTGNKGGALTECLLPDHIGWYCFIIRSPLFRRPLILILMREEPETDLRFDSNSAIFVLEWFWNGLWFWRAEKVSNKHWNSKIFPIFFNWFRQLFLTKPVKFIPISQFQFYPDGALINFAVHQAFSFLPGASMVYAPHIRKGATAMVLNHHTVHDRMPFPHDE